MEPETENKEKQQSAPKSEGQISGGHSSEVHEVEENSNENVVQPNLYAEVIYEFDPEDEDELELTIGDIVIIEKSFDDWYSGRIFRHSDSNNTPDGHVGVFPSKYVKILSSLPSQGIQRGNQQSETINHLENQQFQENTPSKMFQNKVSVQVILPPVCGSVVAEGNNVILFSDRRHPSHRQVFTGILNQNSPTLGKVIPEIIKGKENKPFVKSIQPSSAVQSLQEDQRGKEIHLASKIKVKAKDPVKFQLNERKLYFFKMKPNVGVGICLDHCNCKNKEIACCCCCSCCGICFAGFVLGFVMMIVAASVGYGDEVLGWSLWSVVILLSVIGLVSCVSCVFSCTCLLAALEIEHCNITWDDEKRTLFLSKLVFFTTRCRASKLTVKALPYDEITQFMYEVTKNGNNILNVHLSGGKKKYPVPKCFFVDVEGPKNPFSLAGSSNAARELRQEKIRQSYTNMTFELNNLLLMKKNKFSNN